MTERGHLISGACRQAAQVTPKGKEDNPQGVQNAGQTHSNCCGCNLTASQNLIAGTPATQSVPNSSSSYGDEVG
jgi:hypothetical protein